MATTDEIEISVFGCKMAERGDSRCDKWCVRDSCVATEAQRWADGPDAVARFAERVVEYHPLTLAWNAMDVLPLARAYLALRASAQPTPRDGVFVPMDAWKWLMGENGDFIDPKPPGKYKRNYWWRSELRRRIDAAEAATPPAEVTE